METLNDDCLANIFKLLDLRDQLMLVQVCRRFRSVLQQYIWPIDQKTTILDFNEYDLSVEEFGVFVDCILPFAEVVHLLRLSKLHFGVLKGRCFPNTREFMFSERRPYYMHDGHMLMLSEIFPNLATFRPHGKFTGEHMIRFQRLQHLTLYYCKGVKFEYICELLRTLNLRTLQLDIFHKEVPPLGEHLKYLFALERLSVNQFEMAWLYESTDPAAFTCLRELNILNDLSEAQMQQLMQLLCLLRDGNVLALEFSYCSYVHQLLNNCDFKFYQHLEKLSFLNVSNIADIGRHKNINERFPALRQLYLRACVIEETTDILRLLESELDLLNIEECSTRFKCLQIETKKIAQKRKKPITFNFFENIYHSEDYSESFPVSFELYGPQCTLLHITNLASDYWNDGIIRILFE